MRVLKSPALWVIVILGCIAVFANLGNDQAMRANTAMASDRPSLAQMAKEDSAMREGSVLADIKGRVKKQGDRFYFTDDTTNKSYKCLENLCLQRISTNQQDEERKVIWLVSAKVTEFNGENFLILEKAVRSR